VFVIIYAFIYMSNEKIFSFDVRCCNGAAFCPMSVLKSLIFIAKLGAKFIKELLLWTRKKKSL